MSYNVHVVGLPVEQDQTWELWFACGKDMTALHLIVICLQVSTETKISVLFTWDDLDEAIMAGVEKPKFVLIRNWH